MVKNYVPTLPLDFLTTGMLALGLPLFSLFIEISVSRNLT